MPDLSLREFARQKGVELSAVQKAIENGRIVRKPNGRIDTSQLQAWEDLRDLSKIRAHNGSADTRAPDDGNQPDPSKQEEAGSSGFGTFQKAKVQKEVFVAQLRRLEYEEKAGKLVQRDAVKVAAFRVFRDVRDGLLNIPDRVAAEVAADIAKETKLKVPVAVIERIVHHVWDRETRDILQKLSKGVD